MQQRQFERVPFAARTVVEAGTRKIEAALANVSLKGAMIAFDEGDALPPGAECSVEIKLNISEIVLRFRGIVVHTKENISGIRFTAFDLESMVHLRRLLELNTGNAEKVAEELAALIE